tara:strand:- start:2941 stop:3114 length:174 start_codon:yes stop_codon:yes gene_type:complete
LPEKIEPKKIRVTVQLDPKAHMELKIKSAKLGITMNDIMTDALELYLQETVNEDSNI